MVFSVGADWRDQERMEELRDEDKKFGNSVNQELDLRIVQKFHRYGGQIWMEVLLPDAQ